MTEPDAFHQAWNRAEREREQRDVTARAERPGPHALWQQAGGDRERYVALMKQHGHLVPRADRPVSAEEREAEIRTTFAGPRLQSSRRDVHDLLALLDAERARCAALQEALSTCGDYIVGIGLPQGSRPVWEREYHAIIELIDELLGSEHHPWLAAIEGGR